MERQSQVANPPLSQPSSVSAHLILPSPAPCNVPQRSPTVPSPAQPSYSLYHTYRDPSGPSGHHIVPDSTAYPPLSNCSQQPQSNMIEIAPPSTFSFPHDWTGTPQHMDPVLSDSALMPPPKTHGSFANYPANHNFSSRSGLSVSSTLMIPYHENNTVPPSSQTTPTQFAWPSQYKSVPVKPSAPLDLLPGSGNEPWRWMEGDDELPVAIEGFDLYPHDEQRPLPALCDFVGWKDLISETVIRWHHAAWDRSQRLRGMPSIKDEPKESDDPIRIWNFLALLGEKTPVRPVIWYSLNPDGPGGAVVGPRWQSSLYPSDPSRAQ